MDQLVSESVKGDLQRSDARNAVERILSAVLRLMSTRASPSVEAIAFEADVSVSALYRHFSGKRQIFEATLQYVLSRLRARVLDFMSIAQFDQLAIDQFLAGLFDAAIANRPGLQNIFSSLPEKSVNGIITRHNDFLIGHTLESFDSLFGAEEVRVRRVKVEVLFGALRNLLMDFLQAAPCPIRLQAYQSLFRCSIQSFADHFRPSLKSLFAD